MIKINMNYFIKTIKKHKIINRRKCVNLSICSVDVLSEKLETKVKSSIQKRNYKRWFLFEEKERIDNCCIHVLLNYVLIILQ